MNNNPRELPEIRPVYDVLLRCCDALEELRSCMAEGQWPNTDIDELLYDIHNLIRAKYPNRTHFGHDRTRHSTH